MQDPSWRIDTLLAMLQRESNVAENRLYDCQHDPDLLEESKDC